MCERFFASVFIVVAGCSSASTSPGTEVPPSGEASAPTPARAPATESFESPTVDANLEKIEALREIKERVDADAKAWVTSIAEVGAAVEELNSIAEQHQVSPEQIDKLVRDAAAGRRVSVPSDVPEADHAAVQEQIDLLRERGPSMAQAGTEAAALRETLSKSLRQAQDVWAALEPATVPGQGASEAEQRALARQRDAGASLMRAIEAKVESADDAVDDAVAVAAELRGTTSEQAEQPGPEVGAGSEPDSGTGAQTEPEEPAAGSVP